MGRSLPWWMVCEGQVVGDDVGSGDSNENAQSSKFARVVLIVLMHVTAFLSLEGAKVSS